MGTKPMTVMHDLDGLMRERRASAFSLAKRAGYCRSTIEHARTLRPVTVKTAREIRQALDTFDFGYCKPNYRPPRRVECPSCGRKYSANNCFECVACGHEWGENDASGYAAALAWRAERGQAI